MLGVESGIDIGEAIEAKRAIKEGLAYLTLAKLKFGAQDLVWVTGYIQEAEEAARKYDVMYNRTVPSFRKLEDLNIEGLESLLAIKEDDIRSAIKYYEEIKDELARRRND